MASRELLLDDRFAYSDEAAELDRACRWQKRLRIKRATAARLGWEHREGRGALR